MLDAGVLGIGDTKSDCNRAKKVLKKREIEERKWDIVCKVCARKWAKRVIVIAQTFANRE